MPDQESSEELQKLENDIKNIVNTSNSHWNAIEKVAIYTATAVNKALAAADAALPEKVDMTLPVTDEVFYKSDALKIKNETIDAAHAAIEAQKVKL